MDLEREIVLGRQFDAARPTPVAEAQTGLDIDRVSG